MHIHEDLERLRELVPDLDTRFRDAIEVRHTSSPCCQAALYALRLSDIYSLDIAINTIMFFRRVLYSPCT